MEQTEARKTLKDSPIMWRRINSIGIIIDCNSTYANKLGYAKSEIIGKTIFEHVPKELWSDMNESLKAWFETGQVSDRKITFKKHDGATFPGILHATSLYDARNNLIGSNTVIFDQKELNDEKIRLYENFFKDSKNRLEQIKKDGHTKMDENSKSEFEGLEKMFDMLLSLDLRKFKN